MFKQTLKVKRLHPDAQIPKYQSAGAACFDLHAVMDAAAIVSGASPLTVRTGLAFEIPPGHVLLVYSRSGDGFNRNVRLANCVGVIDSDYTGEVQVKLTGDYSAMMTVEPGQRIAQAMLLKLPDVTIEEVFELAETERGANGFGSTGNK